MNDEWMLRIQALDPGAALKFSEYTQRWYVESRLEIGDGAILSGITEHDVSPDAAVEAFFARITDLSSDEYLASSYCGHRREWRWNGAAFAECTRAEAMTR